LEVFVENCPECGAEYENQMRVSEEAVCKECGLVINEKAFGEYKRKRLNVRSKKPSKCLRGTGAESWILRFKASNSSEDSFAWGLFELEKAAFDLDLPRGIKEGAAFIFAEVVKKRLTKGRRIRYTVAACIYIASRLCGDVRGLREISKTLSIRRREVYRTYIKIRRQLKIKVGPVSPTQYVRGLCNAMGLGDGVRVAAVEILEEAGLNRTQGKNPTAISAAAIYLASQERREKISQQEILRNIRVSDATLRHRLNELRASLEKSKK
jgi:transcription initiation factor TFIIB